MQINMKTMPTSMFRLLIGQETPVYIWYMIRERKVAVFHMIQIRTRLFLVGLFSHVIQVDISWKCHRAKCVLSPCSVIPTMSLVVRHVLNENISWRIQIENFRARFLYFLFFFFFNFLSYYILLKTSFVWSSRRQNN